MKMDKYLFQTYFIFQDFISRYKKNTETVFILDTCNGYELLYTRNNLLFMCLHILNITRVAQLMFKSAELLEYKLIITNKHK